MYNRGHNSGLGALNRKNNISDSYFERRGSQILGDWYLENFDRLTLVWWALFYLFFLLKNSLLDHTLRPICKFQNWVEIREKCQYLQNYHSKKKRSTQCIILLLFHSALSYYFLYIYIYSTRVANILHGIDLFVEDSDLVPLQKSR